MRALYSVGITFFRFILKSSTDETDQFVSFFFKCLNNVYLVCEESLTLKQ